MAKAARDVRAKRVRAAATRGRGRKAAAAKPAPKGRMAPRRADFGAPVEGFFARQPSPLRPVHEALRALVAEAAPEASGAIKWGMPFFTIGDSMMCAIAGFKAHVNLILPGAPGTYPDPEGRLEGEGKTGRHLKLHAIDDLPRDAVRGWLRIAARNAREGRSMR